MKSSWTGLQAVRSMSSEDDVEDGYGRLILHWTGGEENLSTTDDHHSIGPLGRPAHYSKMTRNYPPALKEKKHARIKGPHDGPIERTADFLEAKALQDDAFCERWGSTSTAPRKHMDAAQDILTIVRPPSLPRPRPRSASRPFDSTEEAPRGNKNSNRGMGDKAATQVTRRQ
ncbi:hypothetical protein NHJ13734_009437 [Beauveria thailandica]